MKTPPMDPDSSILPEGKVKGMKGKGAGFYVIRNSCFFGGAGFPSSRE